VPTGVVKQVWLFGLPGTCAGPGAVQIKGSHGDSTTEATLAGSFVTSLQAQGGEHVEIRYKTSLPAAYAIAARDCPPTGCSPGPVPHERTGIPPVTAPAGGLSTIRGELVAGVTATIIAANMRSGQVAMTPVATDGTFELTIGAAPGDTLRVYQDSSPLGSSWLLTVP
jgi:hypothetical protein